MTDPSTLSSPVQLSLRCINLVQKDLLSKSDPFVVIYRQENGPWREVLRTVTIWNNHNPEFPDYILLNYRFETTQPLRFDVYDRDSSSEDLSKHDFLGQLETKLSTIVASRGATFSGELLPRKGGSSRDKLGRIVISATLVKGNKDDIMFEVSAENVDRKNFFGLRKSDPFYVIKRYAGFDVQANEEKWLKVFESEHINNTLNPAWKKQRLPSQQICNGNEDERLRFEVYDFENSGHHQYIGFFETSIRQIEQDFNNSKASYELINDRSKPKKNYINSGIVQFTMFDIIKKHSFLEYIRGGCELNLIVAVDFTASNGNPKEKRSLHYNHANASGHRNSLSHTSSVSPQTDEPWSIPDPATLNDYQKAIIAVGQILQDYDSDQNFPVYGFGGSYNGAVSHCFPLTLQAANVEVHGLPGILDAYQNALNHVALSGPTNFRDIICTAAQQASDFRPGEQKYTTLLIITDGQITDMPQTTTEIISACKLPLSIIIVGVGNADFESMEQLDADDQPLVDPVSGEKAWRDIVQFVPFNKFNRLGYTALSEEVLAEIPAQLEGYFGAKGIKPMAETQASIRHFVLDNSGSVPIAEVVSPGEPGELDQDESQLKKR